MSHIEQKIKTQKGLIKNTPMDSLNELWEEAKEYQNSQNFQLLFYL